METVAAPLVVRRESDCCRYALCESIRASFGKDEEGVGQVALEVEKGGKWRDDSSSHKGLLRYSKSQNQDSCGIKRYHMVKR